MSGAQLEGVRKRTIALRKWFLQGGRCALCGEPIDLSIFDGPESLSPDHIVPKSENGRPSAFENIQATHQQCNFDRGREWQEAKMRERYEARRAAGLPVVYRHEKKKRERA